MVLMKQNGISNEPLTYVRKHIVKRVKANFIILDIYLWIHGIGFTKPFRCLQKNIMVTSLSVLLALLFDGNTFYVLYVNFQSYRISRNSIFIFNFIFNVLEYVQRLLLYKKRRKLNSVVHRISVVYNLATKKNNMTFKTQLCLILLIYDIITIARILKSFSVVRPPQIFGYIGDNYYYGEIPAPHSTRVYYLSEFLRNWGNPNSCISFYFCAICFALKQTLVELKKKVRETMSMQTDYLFHIYNNVADLVSEANDLFHTVLIVTFAMYFLHTFVQINSLLFEGLNAVNEIITLMPLLANSVLFIMICKFSSVVSQAGSDVKGAAHSSPLYATNFNNIRFIMKANENFIGFSILDGIDLNRGFILTAFGTILSYGVMVATYTITS